MGWTHDTGYDPAYAHEGYPAAVLDDGTDTAVHTAAMQGRVRGWRAACECGWRGAAFWPRAEYPESSSMAPDEVDGFDTDTGAFAQWSAHLHTTLPGLAVHDAAQDLDTASRRLDQAVAAARWAGASWTVTGAAAGLTRQSAYQRVEPEFRPRRETDDLRADYQERLMTEPMGPELAAAVADPPDAVAVTYRAAADVLNGGTHAARDGYEPRVVDDTQLTGRTEALDETTQALMIAVAVLRDASAATRPELAALLQRATEAAWNAGAALTDARRLLAGLTAADYDDEE